MVNSQFLSPCVKKKSQIFPSVRRCLRTFPGWKLEYNRIHKLRDKTSPNKRCWLSFLKKKLWLKKIAQENRELWGSCPQNSLLRRPGRTVEILRQPIKSFSCSTAIGQNHWYLLLSIFCLQQRIFIDGRRNYFLRKKIGILLPGIQGEHPKS